MKTESVNLQHIKIEDSFWSKHVNLVREAIIPYQWEAMNDRIADAEPSHCLENFKIAAGEKEGEFYGAVFQDTDIAKWLEAVGFSLATHKDEELEKIADEVIELIARAQCKDGYLNTYFTIKEPDKRWQNLCEGHELYTAGHMMEAAVAYYQGTGKDKFLKVMTRFADLICSVFGENEGQIQGYPGHQEIEIGLLKLYRVTGERKYLEQAKYFIDVRGVGENYFIKELAQPEYKQIFPEFADYDPAYSQSHLPVRLQETAEGHAVRAVYMYLAMADLAYAYKDQGLMETCKRLWNNITEKRMYITGGIGSSGILERFTTDYDLPNDRNYAETCASIGLALFGLRMAQITKEAAYIDVVEQALYNTVLAGIALDGKSFFYVNPLEVWPDNCIDRTSMEHVKPIRQKWFGVACCPPNIARTLASLGQYIYGWDEKEQTLYVNLFVSNESKLGNGAKVEIDTKFPWENTIQLKVSQVPEQGMGLRIRIPEYAAEYTVVCDSEKMNYRTEQGYAEIEVEDEQSYLISFQAPAKFVRANPKVRADAGKVAIMRGPLVYCLEEVDNGANLAAIYLDTSKELKESMENRFVPCVEIEASGWRIEQPAVEETLYSTKYPVLKETTLRAVPYPYWNNRGEGEMAVWIKEMIRLPDRENISWKN